MNIRKNLLTLCLVACGAFTVKAQNFSQTSTSTTRLKSNSSSLVKLDLANSSGSRYGSVYGSNSYFGLQNKYGQWTLRENQGSSSTSFFAGGYEFMRLMRNGTSTSGRLGINTTSPDFDLDVNGTAYASKFLVGTNFLPSGYVSSVSGKMQTEQLDIKPLSGLSYARLDFKSSTNGFIGGLHASTSGVGLQDKSRQYAIKVESGNNIEFSVGGNEFMRLAKIGTSTKGRLGINTASPDFDLDVNGTAYADEFLVGTNFLPSGYVASVDGKMLVEQLDVRPLGTSSAAKMDFKSSSNAFYGGLYSTSSGIGIHDKSRQYAIKVESGNNIEFSVGGSEFMRLMKIGSSTKGRLGINTTSPDFDLDVNGTAYASKFLVGTNSLPSGYVASIDGKMQVEQLDVKPLGTSSVAKMDFKSSSNAFYGGLYSTSSGIGFHDKNRQYAIKVESGNNIEFSVGGNEFMRLVKNGTSTYGRLGINTTAPAFELDVNGKAHMDDLLVGTNNLPSGYVAAFDGKVIAEEITVQLESNWPDYVFAKGYDLMSLEELEGFIAANKHLPGLESAETIDARGTIAVGAINTKLVEKVEELTLYTIELNKEKAALEARLARLEQLVEAISTND